MDKQQEVWYNKIDLYNESVEELAKLCIGHFQVCIIRILISAPVFQDSNLWIHLSQSALWLKCFQKNLESNNQPALKALRKLISVTTEHVCTTGEVKSS